MQIGSFRSLDLNELSRAATGRSNSMFAGALAANAGLLSEILKGARILVTGGAGTIGGETVKQLCGFTSAAIHVADISENYLADLVRDVRNAARPPRTEEFRTFTIDYGGTAIDLLLRQAKAYDFILNFAAHKHVRGERDGYTLLSMFDTNVTKLASLKDHALRNGHGRQGFFAVSTDKAANPSSLMGASKRVMEDVLFDHQVAPGCRTTSARFANVAFSNGSLLQAALRRLSRGEPVAVPEETRRYFVSPSESGELCLLASILGADRSIAIPDLDPEDHLVRLQDVIARLLSALGLEPRFFRDEAECASCPPTGSSYPVLLTPLDTSGEKPFEEFVGDGEMAADWIEGLRRIMRPNDRNPSAISTMLSDVAGMSAPNEEALSERIVELLQRNVAGFAPSRSGKNLDQRR